MEPLGMPDMGFQPDMVTLSPVIFSQQVFWTPSVFSTWSLVLFHTLLVLILLGNT